MGNEELLTTAEAAASLGKSVATVNRLAAAGVLPTAVKLPGKRGARLFSRAAIDALAEVTA